MFKPIRVAFVFAAIVAMLVPATFSAPYQAASFRDERTVNDDNLTDSLASTSTYYSIRRDLRRCVSPICGGYFVKRVNQQTTRCQNGQYMSECYVAEIDWNGQPEVEASKVILRASLGSKLYPRFGMLGLLKASEVWEAATPRKPEGIFYRVRDRGIRCITQPCLTFHQAKLNSMLSKNIAGVDLSGVGANDDLVSRANTAMSETDGLLVAGIPFNVSGPAGTAQSLRATQFFVQARKATSGRPCMKTGCSGQICADHDVVTTCEFRSEYECYKKATCERQADGNCGFTKTPELLACLNRR